MVQFLVQPLANAALKGVGTVLLKEGTKNGLKIAVKVGTSIICTAGSVVAQGYFGNRAEQKIVKLAEEEAKKNGGELPEERRKELNNKLTGKRAVIAGSSAGTASFISGVSSYLLCKAIDASN
jgi:uridine phosphorylase